MTDITRAQVVAEALAWRGTPWHHQASKKAIGTDCVGMVVGVAIELGLLAEDFWRREAVEFSGYSRQPSGGLLLKGLRTFMSEIDLADVGLGDVLLIAWSTAPQHVGIVVPYARGGLAVVHAMESNGSVTEHRLAPELRSKVCNVFRYPGVID